MKNNLNNAHLRVSKDTYEDTANLDSYPLESQELDSALENVELNYHVDLDSSDPRHRIYDEIASDLGVRELQNEHHVDLEKKF